jgi:Tfp pilus assembly protein PilP
MTRLTLVVVAVLLTGAAFAQAPAATPAPPAPTAAAAPADDHMPTPPANFSYTPGGRRDPFLTLARGAAAVTTSDPSMRPAGAAGIAVDELTVRGIVLTNGTFVAMVSGAAGKNQTYSVRAGSRLYDGTVRAIDARSIVIVQQVSDPLSLQKQREVRKLLRTQEEGK